MPDPPPNPRAVDPGAIVEVVDPDDPRLELYRDLHDPAGRIRLEAERSVFVVEGRLAVERLLTSAYPVGSLLVDDHQLSSSADLVAAVRAQAAPVYVATRDVMARTVGFALHRGVVAVGERPEPEDPDRLLAGAVAGPPGPPRLVAVLEGLNDHENIGALFRNAAAFGVAGVLLDPTCADPLYRRSIRVSVGHVLHTPFARVSRWPDGLDRVRAAGFVVAALAPRPAGDSTVPGVGLAALRDRISGPGRPVGVALLLGAEGPGLTGAALARADLVVSIPMAHGVDSLNVATAAAVAFHALVDP